MNDRKILQFSHFLTFSNLVPLTEITPKTYTNDHLSPQILASSTPIPPLPNTNVWIPPPYNQNKSIPHRSGKKIKNIYYTLFSKNFGILFYQNLLILGSPPPPYYDQQLPLNPAAPSAPSATRPTSPSIATLPKPGNRKCERDNCVTCDLLINGTSFRSTMTGKEYKFMPSVGCETTNIIYLVRKAKQSTV